MKYTNNNGLLVDKSTTPPTCAGYIFNFQGRAFAPDGKLDGLTQEEIDTHNRLLADAEWSALKEHGRGVLYLTHKDIPACPPSNGVQPLELKTLAVSTWAGQRFARVYHSRKSWHNMAGEDGRTDVWFMLDGSRWHGVNIGDNDLCRVKRCKA